MQLFRTLFLLVIVVAGLVDQLAAQDRPRFQVFKTTEGQYFVGASGTGKTMGDAVGPESCLLEECQKWIRENWTDMRPLSLQKQMADEGLSVDDTKLRVIINHEEQYSLALADVKAPEGWKDTGRFCLLSDCMKYIEEVWTDMRPLSLRKRPGRTK